jgi:hypothetical protein
MRILVELFQDKMQAIHNLAKKNLTLLGANDFCNNH